MAKRQKYKVGDILEIPLNESLTGYARILYKDIDVLMIECFDIERKNIVMTQRCWNDYIKNGKWKVIDYEEVPENYNYPIFYGQNALTDEYYTTKGEDVLKGWDFEIAARAVIDEKDIVDGMESDGVCDPEIIVEEYLEKLNGGNV